MKYKIEITDVAEQDILEIYYYIAQYDSDKNAEYVFNQIEALCLSLSEQPSRGHVPPELDTVGVKEYLEIHFKPYRIIYQIQGKTVYIHCVVDGRRDMRSFLERRLIR
ncbi:MAG: type II toxin-antitoxin system RelE/ParE family toxin [Gammaproteobacteria bacterium]|nr:type II toxin-antitoxin system RelE/ParE family toxin [Gammaproteobacteria bacterium]